MRLMAHIGAAGGSELARAAPAPGGQRRKPRRNCDRTVRRALTVRVQRSEDAAMLQKTGVLVVNGSVRW